MGSETVLNGVQTVFIGSRCWHEGTPLQRALRIPVKLILCNGFHNALNIYEGACSVKQNRKRPIGVDLFAGAGGMSLGFEQAGFNVAAAVEYDPVHSATHEFNFPNCAAICRSVADIDGQYIRKNSHIGNQKIDVVFGGGPCQGFSFIGKRAVDDPRNSLVRHFVRLVVDMKASYFVFENVRGLTVGAHGKFLDEVIAEFQKGGYRVVEEYRVLNAARFGVPQDRQRLFLIGARKGNRLPEYPAETHEPQNGKNSAAGSMLKATATVWDALKDLPVLSYLIGIGKPRIYSWRSLIERAGRFGTFIDSHSSTRLFLRSTPNTMLFIIGSTSSSSTWQFFLRSPENLSQGTYRHISMLLSANELAWRVSFRSAAPFRQSIDRVCRQCCQRHDDGTI
jgi:DNA-cytosine methyltransferase